MGGGTNWEPLLATGTQIGTAHLLFAKIEDAEIEHQLEKLAQSKLANTIANKVVEPQKETVSFEDFSKLDYACGNHYCG